jgi:hypothetical protein
LVQQGTIRIDIPVSGTDKLNADLQQIGAWIDEKITIAIDFHRKSFNIQFGCTIALTSVIEILKICWLNEVLG